MIPYFVLFTYITFLVSRQICKRQTKTKSFLIIIDEFIGLNVKIAYTFQLMNFNSLLHLGLF